MTVLALLLANSAMGLGAMAGAYMVVVAIAMAAGLVSVVMVLLARRDSAGPIVRIAAWVSLKFSLIGTAVLLFLAPEAFMFWLPPALVTIVGVTLMLKSRPDDSTPVTPGAS